MRRLVEGLSFVLLVCLTAICSVEVGLRNVAGASLGFGDEFAGYLLVWLTFTGVVLAEIDGGHIAAEVGSGRLSAASVLRLSRVVHGILLALQLFLLVYGIHLVAESMEDRATSLPVPMGALYTAVPFSALLLVIVHVVAIMRSFRRDPRAD